MRANNCPHEEAIYRAIRDEIQRHRRRLNYGVDFEDAVHDVWLDLIPYARAAQVKNIRGWVRQMAPRSMNKVIDKASRHHKKRDPRGLN